MLEIIGLLIEFEFSQQTLYTTIGFSVVHWPTQITCFPTSNDEYAGLSSQDMLVAIGVNLALIFYAR